MFRTASVRTASLALTALAGLLAAGCGEDPLEAGSPSMAVVAGEYDATDTFGALTFTTTADGETIDWVAAGASLTLILDADGAVAGRLFIPGGEEDGSDMDADMAGTWTLTGTTVRFQQEADTFVRDMAFTFTDTVLSAEQTFNEVRVRVVLIKQ